MDSTEDLSARVLLKHILSTEPPRTPVTRSNPQAPSSSGLRRSSRLSRKKAEAQTPQDVLRRSLKHKIHESITRKSLSASTKRRTPSVVHEKGPSSVSMLVSNEDTPRHLLRNILQTEPVRSPVVHEREHSEEPDQQSADGTALKAHSSTELSGLDLPDLTISNVVSIAKGLSRKRPHQSLDVTAFEKRLKPGNYAGEEPENSAGDSSLLSLSSSSSLSLKTPFADVQTEKRGLQRKVSNRRKITEREFEAAVSERHIGDVSSLSLVEENICEGTGTEGFTLGLSKLSMPDITVDIVNCNTALYDQSDAMTSNFSILATQDKPIDTLSQLLMDMREAEQEEERCRMERDKSVHVHPREESAAAPQKEEHVSDHETEESIAEPQKEEHVSDHETEESIAEPQNEEHVSDHETEESAAEPQKEEHVSDHETEESIAEPQNEEHVSDHDTEESIAEPQKEEHVSDHETEESAAEPQNEEHVSDHDTEESEAEAEPQTEEGQKHLDDKAADASESEREEDVVESEREEDAVESEREEDAVESEREEDAVESEREEDAVESEREEDAVESEREEDAVESKTNADAQTEEEGADNSHSEENDNLDDLTEKEEVSPDSQRDEEEIVEKEECFAGSQTEESSQSEEEECELGYQTEEVETVALSQDEVEAGSEKEEVSPDSQIEEEDAADSQADEVAAVSSSQDDAETASQSKEEAEDVAESQTEDEEEEEEQLEGGLEFISQKAHRSEGALILPIMEARNDLDDGIAAGLPDAKSKLYSTFDLNTSAELGIGEISQTQIKKLDMAELSVQDQEHVSCVENKSRTENENLSQPHGLTLDAEVSERESVSSLEDAQNSAEQEEEWDDEEEEVVQSKTPAFVKKKRIFYSGSPASPSVLKNTEANLKSEALPAAKPKQVRQRKTGTARKQGVLPKTYLMSVFRHFAKTKVSADVYPVLNEITDKFLDRLAKDLETYAAHAKRKTIEVEDAILLLKRQGYVNDKVPVEVLIEKYLRMEQRKLLIPMATSGNVVIPKKRK